MTSVNISISGFSVAKEQRQTGALVLAAASRRLAHTWNETIDRSATQYSERFTLHFKLKLLC